MTLTENIINLKDFQINSERSWNEMYHNYLVEEMKYVLTEEKEDLSKDKKKFFTKLIEWFKKVFLKIRLAIGNFIKKMLVRTGRGKDLAKNAKLKNPNAEVKVGDYLQNYKKTQSKITEVLKTLDSNNDPLGVDFGKNEKNKVKVSAVYKNALVVLNNIDGQIGDIKKLVEGAKKVTNEGIKAAKEAASGMKEKAKLSLEKRRKLSNINLIASKIISVLLSIFGDAVKVIKKASGKGKDEDEKSKNESFLIDLDSDYDLFSEDTDYDLFSEDTDSDYDLFSEDTDSDLDDDFSLDLDEDTDLDDDFSLDLDEDTDLDLDDDFLI